ncbi:transmembrane cytochrome oxidase associated protein [Pseudoalteromonas sp. L21]|uniref:transmembrane cytochrome oxidase associated protein n=1 Tax=Pseudoalteromonas sp. L21 TaxID=1539746 RepID=UPI001F422D89|nr:transmembrane cytochrome oxidase associated protein [Pseudoalteromonas sp. L21]MCF7520154.1 transmembrane cytochrome oxidase associated protein [Pseudoalteromonas sp. L21]
MKINPLSLFALCCFVPLILAFAALKLEWLPSGSSNHGELLKTEVKLADWQQGDPKQWTIALNYPDDCQLRCEEQLASLENLYVALGKNQQKVDVAVLSRQQKTAANWRHLEENADLQAGDLYLVDHMGLVVLHYPYKKEPEENRLIQKGLLKDLKKLLNYARSS